MEGWLPLGHPDGTSGINYWPIGPDKWDVGRTNIAFMVVFRHQWDGHQRMLNGISTE